MGRRDHEGLAKSMEFPAQGEWRAQRGRAFQNGAKRPQAQKNRLGLGFGILIFASQRGVDQVGAGLAQKGFALSIHRMVGAKARWRIKKGQSPSAQGGRGAPRRKGKRIAIAKGARERGPFSVSHGGQIMGAGHRGRADDSMAGQGGGNARRRAGKPCSGGGRLASDEGAKKFLASALFAGLEHLGIKIGSEPRPRIARAQGGPHGGIDAFFRQLQGLLDDG